MARKRRKPEEVVAKPRQVEVLAAQGKTVAGGARATGVAEATRYRWRSEYGGPELERLEWLEQENGRLRKAVADLTLEKLALKEAASGSFWAPPAAGPASSRYDEAGRSGALRLPGAGPAPLDAAKAPAVPDGEAAPTDAITGWGRRHGRYGHRRITALPRAEGWRCNRKFHASAAAEAWNLSTGGA